MIYKSDTGTMTYGQNAGPHAVTLAGGYSYQYDANGNMIQGKNKTLSYDAENRLIEVNQSSTISAYSYDGDGGRVKKTSSLPGGAAGTNEATYIGSLFEKDSSGKTTKHIFAGSNRVASVESIGNTYYYHSDHLGSSNIITNQGGQQVQYCEYTPYGSLAKNEGEDAVKYKFTGKELDSTGLYYYGARYYDPEIGRFITADTIIQAPYDSQSLNRYSYCRNNPINYIDPTGHKWSWGKFWHAAAGAILGVALAVVLGPAGIGMSMAMAGMWGGMAGGALTGGLEGGWQGALIGAGIGGALGAVGGWAAGGEHYWAMGAMLAAGAGVAGATNSWDSFAGGLTGGVIGGLAGGGIVNSYSEQFGNYRAGNGFASNRDARFNQFSQEMKVRHALNVNQKDTTVQVVQRPLGKDMVGNPGSTIGPRHRAIISDKFNSGSWQMGPDPISHQITTTNTVDNLSGWGTHMCTENSLNLGGRYIESFNVGVNFAALQDNIGLYESTFAGQLSYVAMNHNSNFAVNSVIYGAGGDVPGAGWAPGFPDKP